jgi:septum formation protein
VTPRLVLASASPRRRDLLRRIGVAPDLIAPSDIDETPEPAELPHRLAARLAAAKCGAALPDHAGAFVLAADTVVGCGRRILPKAETENEARACLALLSGRRHRVTTGVALGLPDGRTVSRTVTTVVRFKRLSPVETDAYLLSGEWRGKAGGYAIQGLAEAFVASLQGSYSNVVGLPLHETAKLLDGNGYPVWRGA